MCINNVDWSWPSQSSNQQTHNWPLQQGTYVPRHAFSQVIKCIVLKQCVSKF